MSLKRIISNELRDSDWVRKTFLLSDTTVSDNLARWKVYSSVFAKYTNTSLGGNFAINSPPSFTRYADIKSQGTSISTSKNDYGHGVKQLGMGRYYSEAIDDNSQLVHMRFGTPRFNGMLTFFTSFYENKAAMLAREGRAGIMYYGGLVVGTLVTLPLSLIILAGKAFRYFSNRPVSKYYYMVPAMGPYWNRVNFIANAIAVNMFIAPRITAQSSMDKNAPGPQEDTQSIETEDYRTYAARNYPDMYDDNGNADIYRIANKASRLRNQRDRQLREIVTGATSRADVRDRALKFLYDTKISDPGGQSIKDYLTKYHQSVLGNVDKAQGDYISDRVKGMDLTNAQSNADPSNTNNTGATAAGTTANPGTSYTQGKDSQQNFLSKFVKSDSEVLQYIGGFASDLLKTDYFEADMDEGSQFVTFRVDNPGTVSESFTNTVRDSDVASMFNSTSSNARNLMFNLSGGATGIPGVDDIIEGVVNLGKGLLDSMYLGGIAALAGNAFIDIPKHYDTSTSQFPSSSFSMELRTWSGNRQAQFNNLIVPICMLLAAGLPISTGRQSYTQPFLCEMYYQGRNQIRLGMIDSISITRGVGNMGWNNQNQPLGFDVQFNVVDLSTVMHAPIDVGFDPLNPTRGIFDDHNAFNDYMATLASMNMAIQISPVKEFYVRLAAKNLEISSYFSRSHFSNAFSNSETVQTLAALFNNDNDRTF